MIKAPGGLFVGAYLSKLVLGEGLIRERSYSGGGAYSIIYGILFENAVPSLTKILRMF